MSIAGLKTSPNEESEIHLGIINTHQFIDHLILTRLHSTFCPYIPDPFLFFSMWLKNSSGDDEVVNKWIILSRKFGLLVGLVFEKGRENDGREHNFLIRIEFWICLDLEL